MAAWAAACTLTLVVGLALIESRGTRRTAPDQRSSVDEAYSRPNALVEERRAALEYAEWMLNQSPTSESRLQVARCTWALARTLPSQRGDEYRHLLRQADALLRDPTVTDILTPADRCMKARIVIELAPVMDLPLPDMERLKSLANGAHRNPRRVAV